MVIIPHQEDERFTYEDFDFMCTIIAGKERLLQGKTLNMGRTNQKKLFSEGVILLIMGTICYFFEEIFGYVLSGFGMIVGLLSIGLYIMTKASYKKILDEGEIKGDTVFDEKGIHVWENELKGFDAPWEDLLHCFISKLRIIIIFRAEHLVIDMPYTPENKNKIIEGLKVGHKLSAVKLLDYDNGKIKIREIKE